MTDHVKHTTGGRAYREQVVYGGKKIPGLFERTTNNGRHVFELRRKIAGRAVRHTLTATTATDAIREQRAFLAKLDAGVRLVRHDDITLRELRNYWEGWAKSPASSLAARTVELYSPCSIRPASILPYGRALSPGGASAAPRARLLPDARPRRTGRTSRPRSSRPVKRGREVPMQGSGEAIRPADALEVTRRDPS